MTTDRLSAARERLRAALVAGQATDDHREAVERLERDLAAADARSANANAAADLERAGIVRTRSEQLAADARERIARSLSRFDVEFLKP